MKKIELLAPAGSYESLVAAVESGADAVYIGGSKFNARASADNFDCEMLRKAVEYAHIRGVKVYVTVNILVMDKELEEIIDYVGFLYSIDVDAIIVQDMALIKIINQYYPNFHIHCSTQMTVHNTEGAKAYSNMGVKRIVLARELSINEISQIVKNTGTEIEIFIHGALCVSYSGQCLMSSMIGGRSGNRGRCAQPCRKKYTFINTKTNKLVEPLSNKHLMSTRDLNTYKRISEIIKSGVTSLKIEGRMKRPEYVAVVTKSYRHAIDRVLQGHDSYFDNTTEYELKSVFNREFTEGYIFSKRNRELVSIERPDNRGVYIGTVTNRSGNFISVIVENNFISDGDSIEIVDKNGKTTGTVISGIKSMGESVKTVSVGQKAEIFIRDKVAINSLVNKIVDRQLFQKALGEYSYNNKKKIPVSCKLKIKVDEYPVIELIDFDGNSISYTGEEKIQLAQKIATTKEKIISQLNKTGDVPFYFENISIDIDEQCNIPSRIINELRRESLQCISKKRTNRNNRNQVKLKSKQLLKQYIKDDIRINRSIEVVASVRNLESVESAISAGTDIIYIMYYWRFPIEEIRDIIALCKINKRKCFILLPTITKDSEMKLIERDIIDAVNDWNDIGLVISNIGQFEFARNHTAGRVRLNYTFNIFNSVSANSFSDSPFYKNIECINLSPELNINQIKAIAKNTEVKLEGLVYGHIPVMTTDYCSLSLINECGNCGGSDSWDSTQNNYALVDERDKVFPIYKEGFCRNKILNSDVLCLIQELNTIATSGISSLRADFYMESGTEIFDIIKFMKSENNNIQQQKDIIHSIKEKGFTKGHYFRGVD